MSCSRKCMLWGAYQAQGIGVHTTWLCVDHIRPPHSPYTWRITPASYDTRTTCHVFWFSGSVQLHKFQMYVRRWRERNKESNKCIVLLCVTQVPRPVQGSLATVIPSFFLFHTQHVFRFHCAPVGWCRAISIFGPASAFSSGLKHFHLPSMSARLDHVPQQCTCVASFYTFCSFSMLYELFLPNVWTVSVLYPACSYSLFFLPFSALPTKLFFFFLFHGSVTPQFRFIFWAVLVSRSVSWFFVDS